jgi:quercetin dioxygenase-like cupin family protein
MRALAVPSSLLLLLVPALRGQAAPAAKPAALQWGPAPAVLPKGAKMAVVTGDPTQAAPFTVELAMPAGYKFPPHFHPTDETVTVKKGTLLIGMGDTFEADKMKAMKAGETGSVPANAHHFAATRGATVISVSAMGPFAMTYVNAADDPQKRAAAR